MSLQCGLYVYPRALAFFSKRLAIRLAKRGLMLVIRSISQCI